jgi:hypothetical protein
MRLPREWPDDIVGAPMRSGRHLHFRFLRVVCWRCRPVSSRLVRILQIRAFPFRHCTEFGSPSQNRTEVGRFRAGRFATKLRGGSCFAFGWQLVSLRCSAHRPRASKARTLLHELQAVLRSAALPWERSVIAIARSRPSRLAPHYSRTNAADRLVDYSGPLSSVNTDAGSV